MFLGVPSVIQLRFWPRKFRGHGQGHKNTKQR